MLIVEIAVGVALGLWLVQDLSAIIETLMLGGLRMVSWLIGLTIPRSLPPVSK
jgi:hypothetical protein